MVNNQRINEIGLRNPNSEQNIFYIERAHIIQDDFPWTLARVYRESHSDNQGPSSSNLGERLGKSVFFLKEFKTNFQPTKGSFPFSSYRLASIRSKKSPPNDDSNRRETVKIIDIYSQLLFVVVIPNTADNDCPTSLRLATHHTHTQRLLMHSSSKLLFSFFFQTELMCLVQPIISFRIQQYEKAAGRSGLLVTFSLQVYRDKRRVGMTKN